MKLKTLPPVYDKPSYWEELEKKLVLHFKSEIYLPLLREFGIKSSLLKNSYSGLRDLISTGDVRYVNGSIAGDINATASKELKRLGAKWDKSKGWVIALDRLPVEVRDEIQRQSEQDKLFKFSVDESLNKIRLDETFNATTIFDKTVYKVATDFKESTKRLEVLPTLSPTAKKQLAKQYSENLNLFVREFTEKQVLELRKTVQDMTFKGNRNADLAKQLEASYGVTKRKAKFLARQETTLLTSNLKEVQYESIGIDEYYWVSVAGTALHPVRPMHKKLNDESKAGKKFKFSNPPVDDPNGSKHNPGQNYGCRCVARPIVKF